MAPASNGSYGPVPEWQQKAERDLDRALRTLSFAVDFAASGGPKPVVLHSARVGLLLNALGYSRDVQVAGALHELVEDTHFPLHDIAHDFGDDVAYLVASNTFDNSIEDFAERYVEGFARCLDAGAAAATVMAANLYDNAPYGDLAWLEKPRYFLEHSQRLIGHEPVWQLLRDRVLEMEECLLQQAARANEEPR
jgi:hypothetical protein